MAAIPQTQPTVSAIYAAYEAKGNKPYISPRLGSAMAGAECGRSLWYSFHWTTRKIFTGRMLRLFQTGHIEEARMVADLRSAGVTVLDVNPDDINPKTGKQKQWELTDETGHVVCRMDAAMFGVKEMPETWMVGEYKTHNDKSFKALLKDGILKSKPEHFTQCQIGMHLSGMTHAFYMARNKDTDALWSDILTYDEAYSTRLMERLGRIIFGQNPPQRISRDPSFFKCKFCDHSATCHQGKLPARSCRTCLHSQPENGATWRCVLRDELRDRDQQRDGCSSHLYIPDFVKGEQVDVIDTETGPQVSYTMDDGTEWIDNGEV